MSKPFNCTECAAWLHPYLDNELGTEMAARVNMHLAHCAECQAKFAELQVLRSAIRQHVPLYTAPELLQQRILSQVTRHSSASLHSRSWVAPALSFTALAACLMLYIATPSSRDMLIDEAVSSHVRSLKEQHLMDVVSSDKHTVKPWFTGRIDFSPPVVDLADQGYPLLGGRLDYLSHQDVAALSYRRNKHIINLFVMLRDASDSSVHTTSKHGYNIVYWQKSNMAFEAVSDLNPQELEAFAKLIADRS